MGHSFTGGGTRWCNASAVTPHEPSAPYQDAIRRAFDFARQTGTGCRPVHFLVGIAEGNGPASAALRPADGGSLRAVVEGMSDWPGGAPAAYLNLQAQQGAQSLASARSEPAGVEHLLVALLDQGTPEVLDALSQARLDPAAIRRAALAALGAPDDLPRIAFEPVTPAGTLDRPALPVPDLSQRAWALLCWRQDHLPLRMLHRRSDTDALIHLERRAVGRLADRLALDDDQRFSLLQHHEQAVDERVARARSDVARLRGRPAGRPRPPLALRPPWRRFRWLGVTVGWRVWVSNRRVAARDRWFRLRAARAYRGAPLP